MRGIEAPGLSRGASMVTGSLKAKEGDERAKPRGYDRKSNRDSAWERGFKGGGIGLLELTASQEPIPSPTSTSDQILLTIQVSKETDSPLKPT